MPEVKSRALTHLDYDAGSRRLFVTFVTGRLYVYEGVPPDVYEALLRAPSKGRFFNREIKDRYPATLARRRNGPLR